MTNCYYISAAGADSNDGTSESKPWLHLPGMPKCTGACDSTKPEAGTGFILRGGDTWHFGNSSASPYTGGTWTWHWNGSSESPIYVGVDQTWYSGSSWSRPVLNGDNPTSTSTTLTGCPYQVGSGNVMFAPIEISYLQFDNFEMTGMCQAVYGSFGRNVYVEDPASQYSTFEHLYIHGWTHKQFACKLDLKTHEPVGMCYGASVFLGSNGSRVETGIQYLYDVIDGEDSDPAGWMQIYDPMFTMAYSVLNNGSQIVSSLGHTFHDNLVMNWVDPGDKIAHGNLYEEVDEPSGTNAIYNNVWFNAYNRGIAGVCFWPAPPVGSTLYVFNNVWYNVECGGNYFNIGQNRRDQGTINLFNNTLENPQNGAILTCASSRYSAPFTAANNHYITDSTPYFPSCRRGTKIAEVPMSHRSAKRQGYAASEIYGYSPVIGSGPTIGIGTNEQSFCSAMIASGDPMIRAAGTSCRSDTTYACRYNSTNHTVICPARAATARPSGSPWDAGAYQSQSAAQSRAGEKAMEQ